MKVLYCLMVLLSASSCGYRFESNLQTETPISLTVPYVNGDFQGRFTDALVESICQSGVFKYKQNGGRLRLQVSIIDEKNDRIGFRFDRDDKSGKLRDNIIEVENRKELIVELELVDSLTDETILGPLVLSDSIEFDYVDENSLKDLSFIGPFGQRIPVVSFSLGQLDSKDTSVKDVLTPLYHRFAKRIVDALIVSEICL